MYNVYSEENKMKLTKRLNEEDYLIFNCSDVFFHLANVYKGRTEASRE